MNFATVETALAAWVQAVTGLAAAAVYFSHQGQRAVTTGNRISITVGDLAALGQPETIQSYAATPVGQEISLEALSMATLGVSLQAFGPAVVGATGPRQLLAALRASLGLETYRAPLRAAGLGVNLAGPVRWVPGIAGLNFEGRAVLELLFSSSESALEKTGYISTVKVGVTLDGTDLGEVTLSA